MEKEEVERVKEGKESNGRFCWKRMWRERGKNGERERVKKSKYTLDNKRPQPPALRYPTLPYLT